MATIEPRNASTIPAITDPSATDDVIIIRGGKWKRTDLARLVGSTPFLATGGTTPRSAADRAADVISLKEMGAVGDGVENDQAALLAAIAALPETGGTIIVSDGVYKCGSATISKPNVVIKGGGTFLDTTILVDGLVAQTVMNTHIHDVAFRFTAKTGDVHAVVVKRAWYVKVDHCDFDGPDACVYIPQIDSGQHTGRLFVADNTVKDSNYLFFADRAEGAATVLTSADCHISNNVAVCEVCHVKGLGLDGVDIKGNTFFFPGYQSHNANKTSNIYLDRANWIIIQGNNLFEAGQDAIYIARGQNFNITGNNIAWPGQRDLFSGIRIAVSDVSGSVYSMGVITANNIQFPTKYGIWIDGLCGYISVYGNQIKSAGASTYYYGTTDIGSIFHYGIYIDATCINVAAINNISPDNVNFIGSSTNRNVAYGNLNNGATEEFASVLTANGTETTLTLSRANVVNLAQTAPTTITSLGSPAYYKTIKIYAFNSNTTIQNNASIRLKGGINVNIPTWGSISLDWVSSQWIESCRSF